ncbi:hypothetical protein PFICI_07716 [Pestalotiopsis fici W106-1]|uniref:EKC/KEOPS complex subunit BUD32 n=1 Tax=Pestalotiopsis fici (strain W106-1 / CGMCC3.15140) TaxID=1229662 RepID=W3X468_PESFW|nr:uncharacterized protein PFICI_07716 [Pestalotiopsis fici W106-1]ETS80187.1 hypothetical protein PFICI_07716 [Pestalotiopsis fici W106-1]
MAAKANVYATPPEVDFAAEVGSMSRTGVDGFGQDQLYVPYDALVAFWTPQRISEVVDAYNLQTPRQIIKDKYLRIFSILVYGNCVQYFPDLVSRLIYDGHLPLSHRPATWPDADPFQDMLDSFLSNQWRFCPLIFKPSRLNGHELHSQQIFPLLQKTCLAGSNVFRVEVDASCDKLPQTDHGPQSHTYVLKTYTGKSGRKLYDNERKALTVIARGNRNNIVKFFGSFAQNKTYNLVLEFVDSGNLLEFFQKTPPPASSQDVHDFWTSYSGLFEGVREMHQVTASYGRDDIYRIVHQDIRPENILLGRSGKVSRYQFQPKIADFKYSHMKSVRSDDRDMFGLDRLGRQRYAALDFSHYEPDLHRGPNRITAEADIFSLGYMTSDAAAWVLFGQNGRTAYHQKRLLEAATIQGFKGSGYGGCFHDGIEMLNAVKNMHREIKGHEPRDQLTSSIIDVVETHMLSSQPHLRMPAAQLKYIFEEILNGRIPAFPFEEFFRGSLKVAPAQSLRQRKIAAEDSVKTSSPSSVQGFDKKTKNDSENIAGSMISMTSSGLTQSQMHSSSFPQDTTTAPTSTGPQLSSLNEEDRMSSDDLYSDAGSIAGTEHTFANMFQNELLQDFDVLDMAAEGFAPMLSQRLKEFAIRLGHEEADKDHQDMKYIVHKYHQRLANEICQRRDDPEKYSQSDKISSQGTEISSSRGDPTFSAFYLDEGNIRKWNAERTIETMADLPEEIPAEEPDFLEDRISRGHMALRASEAYKWLVSTIRRQVTMADVQAIQMESHRKWLLTLLSTPQSTNQIPRPSKVQRRRQPPIYTVKMRLNWDIMRFIGYQEYAEQDLNSVVSRTITLSGDGLHVQALPCQEYLEQCWPSIGPDICKLMDELVHDPKGSHHHILPDKTEISVEIDGEAVLVESTGTEYGLAEVTEQLLWLSAALQQPTDELYTKLIVAEPTGVFIPTKESKRPSKAPGFAPEHIGTVDCSVNFISEPLELSPEDSSGSCWQSLFHHRMIANGYPIPPRRSKRPGLEIPLDMMAALAGADRLTTFGERLLLKGFSTILFPSTLDDDCIFWHLERTDGNSRISFADKRIPPTSQTESFAYVGQINQARHIVGWAANVKQKIGKDMEANYAVGPSLLSEREANSGFVLEKVNLSAGYYITVGSTFARGRREFGPVIAREGDFRQELRDLKERFIILHDVGTRTAWLSDGLSVLLHLIRANIDSGESLDGLLRQEDLKEMEGKDGRAFETLKTESNLWLRARRKINLTPRNETETKVTETSSYIHLGDILKDIMHILWQILDNQADPKDKSPGFQLRLSPWNQLEGYDFRDIARVSRTIKPKKITLRDDAEGWVSLTRAIDAPTLFGRDFGSLLEPTEISSNGICVHCHWNCPVPEDRDILAVLGSDIEWVTGSRGNKVNGQWRILNDLYLDGVQTFHSRCPYANQQGDRIIKCQQRILQVKQGDGPEEMQKRKGEQQKRRLWSRWKSKVPHPEMPGNLEDLPDLNGRGLIIGMPNKRLQKNRRLDSSSRTIARAISESRTSMPSDKSCVSFHSKSAC